MSLQDDLKEMHNADQKELADSLKEINDLAKEAYEAKVAAAKAEAHAKELKNKLAAMMETAGVDKIATDLCTVSGGMKTSTTVPKDAARKKVIFKYIQEKYGPEVIGQMLTINPKSFSSWYDAEVAAAAKQGDLEFKLDIDTYSYYSVGFRKKAGK